MKNVYEELLRFKKKYSSSIAWRLKKHAKIVEKHLNPDEEIIYAFAAQKNNNPLDIITTYAVVLTNKRIILASKRVLFGYFFTAVTPDMFNDLKVHMGLIWGKIYIDTIKEFIPLSNISRNALPEIETYISEYMMKKKSELSSKEKK